tara:strand:- start:242 stop:991 length:750 start_codon:yes stop_codon:yes gene_type:complete
MKLIKTYKSPNFNDRKSKKVLFIIIHYTALNNFNEAISYLCNKNKKVSSHYLISQSGDIYYLVDEKKRAWHAGLSFWDGHKDLNSLSVGIELDFSDKKKNKHYSKKMINSLINLIKYLKKKYNINKSNILGHSDIAPFRKIDPGRKFPWNRLINSQLTLNIKKNNSYIKLIIKKWFAKYNLIRNEDISIFILGFIGYDTNNVKRNKKDLHKLLKVYQSRFIKKNITGKIDNITTDCLLNHLINILLTKN